jgi:hypothetical protein
MAHPSVHFSRERCYGMCGAELAAGDRVTSTAATNRTVTLAGYTSEMD